MKLEQLGGLEKPDQTRAADRVSGNQPVKSDSPPPLLAPKPVGPQDRVSISHRAETIASLIEQVKSLGDIRQQRVDSLREIVTRGEYHPSASEIADSIIREEGPFSS